MYHKLNTRKHHLQSATALYTDASCLRPAKVHPRDMDDMVDRIRPGGLEQISDDRWKSVVKTGLDIEYKLIAILNDL